MTIDSGNAQAPEGAQEPDAQGGELTPAQIRESKFFKQITGNQAAEINALKAQIAELTNAEKKREETRAMKLKEEKGQFDEIKAELMARNEQLVQSHAQEITKLKLENEFARKGASEYFTEWAISRYDGTGISEYVEALAKDEAHAAQFGAPQVVADPQPAPRGAVPASAGTDDWKQVQKDLTSSDPAVRNAADRKVFAFMSETGKDPFAP